MKRLFRMIQKRTFKAEGRHAMWLEIVRWKGPRWWGWKGQFRTECEGPCTPLNTGLRQGRIYFLRYLWRQWRRQNGDYSNPGNQQDVLGRELRVRIAGITDYWGSFLELCLCTMYDNSNNWNPFECVSLSQFLLVLPDVSSHVPYYFLFCAGHCIWKINCSLKRSEV